MPIPTRPERLLNAEERNLLVPHSFQIPPRLARENQVPGVHVKVAVEFDVQPDGCGGERFWVCINSRVSRARSVEYIGTIDNDLVHTEHHGLKADMQIRFGPEHILQIDE